MMYGFSVRRHAYGASASLKIKILTLIVIDSSYSLLFLYYMFLCLRVRYKKILNNYSTARSRTKMFYVHRISTLTIQSASNYLLWATPLRQLEDCSTTKQVACD